MLWVENQDVRKLQEKYPRLYPGKMTGIEDNNNRSLAFSIARYNCLEHEVLTRTDARRNIANETEFFDDRRIS